MSDTEKTTDEAKPQRKRGLRSDIGRIKFLERDEFALTWIGQQYAIRLDQLQWLLGTMAGSTAEHDGWITETAARNVVARWRSAGWVEAEQIRAREPLWIWPTRKGLRKAGLPYNYRDIEQTGLDDLKHLYAINEIRLCECDEKETRWVSERQLLYGLQHPRGKDLLHRPDAIAYWGDGRVIAIEAELSTKITRDLLENLMELVRGEEYLRLKNEYGPRRAREMAMGERGEFSEIWYFGPPKVRRQVRTARKRLVDQGHLTEDEAGNIYTCWYPLTQTDEEEALEERENEGEFDRSVRATHAEEDEDEEIRLSSSEDREREV